MTTRAVIFRLGGITVTMYGVLVALGIALGYIISLYEADKRRIRTTGIEHVTLYMLIGGIVVSRLYYVIVNFGFFTQHPLALIRPWEGGWSVMGALLGAVVGLRLATGAKGFAKALDTFMPGLLATLAIWRLAELFTWSGRGMIVGENGYAFPFPIQNVQGLNCEPVCIYEVAVALIVIWYFYNRRSYHSSRYWPPF